MGIRKIYYGMSGAFKGSTIRHDLKLNPDTQVMYSGIKSWKKFHESLFKDLLPQSDLHFSLLHLVRLEEFMSGKPENFIIERGVTDSLFYNLYNDEYNSSKPSEETIKKTVEAEQSLLGGIDNLERVLLIQEDVDFVKNIVFKEESRAKTFNYDPDYYFQLQKTYVEFTMTHNKVDNVVRIKDAREYILNTLEEQIKFF